MFDALRNFGARVAAFAASSRLDRDFDRELDTHVAMLADENVARGMSPADARREAVVRVGNRSSLKARHRDARALPFLESIAQDVTLAFRLIAKTPSFSAAIVVTLALGIAMNALGFTIINAAFLRGMPFEDGKSLRMITWATKSGRRAAASLPELEVWRARSRTFSGIAAFDTTSMSLSDGFAPPEQVDGAWMSANAFDVLRQQPLLGRAFRPEDGLANAETVAVIGAKVWRNRYGNDPSVLGRPIRLNGRPATIIGVMPEDMRFPVTADLWAPFIRTEEMERRSSRGLSAFGRLDHQFEPRTAQTELEGLASTGLPTDPEATKDLIGVRVETINDFFIGGKARPMFMVVMGAVWFVLLIACVNVANLLLSRAVTRGREMAVRISLGATRARLIRQLIIENAVFSVVGGAIGLLLATVGVGAFDASLEQSGKPFWLIFSVDYAVIGYVAAICLFTSILFGLAPALQISKTNANEVLKEGGRGTVGSRRSRWMAGSLVVAEISLTVVLLIGAGLMVRSFFNTFSLNIGIQTEGLMSMAVELPEQKYDSADTRRAFFARIEERLAALPGLQGSALTTGAPPFDGGERMIELEGQSSDQPERWVSSVMVSRSFFSTIGLAVLRGRNFQDSDRLPDANSVIVNQAFAARLFGGGEANGRRVRFKPRGAEPGPWQTIVGVVPSIRQGSLQDRTFGPVIYLLLDQNPPAAASLLVRSTLRPAEVMNAVRAEVQALDPDQPVLALQTVDDAIADASFPLPVFGALFSVFGLIALTMSAVGLYGVMAYAVSQRTQEIGVRMAMGASWQQVAGQVLGRGLKHLAAGLVIGLVGSFALGGVIPKVLIDIEPSDPLTFAAIAVLLTAVSVFACLLPARRAARVDPVTALRAE